MSNKYEPDESTEIDKLIETIWQDLKKNDNQGISSTEVKETMDRFIGFRSLNDKHLQLIF
jgi:hypothetical protein